VYLDELLQAHRILNDPADGRPPAGPMASYAATRLTGGELRAAREQMTDGLESLPDDVVACTRAFPIPALEGATFTCAPDQFEDRLEALLVERLPPTTWHISSRRHAGGLVEKYGLLDGTYVAPPDDAVGQTMMLDLAGTATTPGTAWTHGMRFAELVEITIEHATWTNVGRLGVGSEFYL
jgi:hypothetical protein